MGYIAFVIAMTWMMVATLIGQPFSWDGLAQAFFVTSLIILILEGIAVLSNGTEIGCTTSLIMVGGRFLLTVAAFVMSNIITPEGVFNPLFWVLLAISVLFGLV